MQTHIPSFSTRTTRGLLLGSLLALGLAACGASPAPIGESEQPITAGDEAGAGEGDSGPPTTAACASGTAADSPAANCQIVARGLCFADAEAACACAGCGTDTCAIAESFPEQAFCPSSGGGSDPDGSTSDDPNAPVGSEPQGGGSSGYPGSSSPGFPGDGSDGSPGCGEPGQTDPSPPSPPSACGEGVARDPSGVERCDFIVDGSCFDSSASACACAGCSEDGCMVLESYPAQIRCQ
jgi:hypothetical protein